mmetsp:Transcript_117226/g.331714  ORF Transcript_117226/g.331714 Transcript_117226/m.331714 type:complete len:205 (-) Transcript_117226:11-625(-)
MHRPQRDCGQQRVARRPARQARGDGLHGRKAFGRDAGGWFAGASVVRRFHERQDVRACQLLVFAWLLGPRGPVQACEPRQSAPGRQLDSGIQQPRPRPRNLRVHAADPWELGRPAYAKRSPLSRLGSEAPHRHKRLGGAGVAISWGRLLVLVPRCDDGPRAARARAYETGASFLRLHDHLRCWHSRPQHRAARTRGIPMRHESQ